MTEKKKNNTVKPLLRGPAITRILSIKLGPEINVLYFPLQRTPIQLIPLLSGRGH